MAIITNIVKLFSGQVESSAFPNPRLASPVLAAGLIFSLTAPIKEADGVTNPTLPFVLTFSNRSNNNPLSIYVANPAVELSADGLTITLSNINQKNINVSYSAAGVDFLSGSLPDFDLEQNSTFRNSVSALAEQQIQATITGILGTGSANLKIGDGTTGATQGYEIDQGLLASTTKYGATATGDPLITLPDGTSFIPGAGAGAITGGNGIDFTASVVSVDLADTVIFVSVSSGAADSGKVARLNASGKIPDAFVNLPVAFGGDGSDGALNVTTGTTTLNLGQVYNYSSINISSESTLTFTRIGGAALLNCSGTTTIAGTIELRNTVTAKTNISTSMHDLESGNIANTFIPNTGGIGGIDSTDYFSGGNGGNSPDAGNGTGGAGGVGATSNGKGTAGGNGQGGNSLGGGGGGGGAGGGASGGLGYNGGPGFAGSNAIGNNGGNGGNGGTGGGFGSTDVGGAGGGGGGGWDTGNGGNGGAGGLDSGNRGNGGNGGHSGANGGIGGNGGAGSRFGNTNNGGDGYAGGGAGGENTKAGADAGNGGNSSHGNGGNGGNSLWSSGAANNGGNGGNGRNGGNGGNGGGSANSNGGNGGNGGNGSGGATCLALYSLGNLTFSGTGVINAQGGNGGNGGNGGGGSTNGNGGNGGNGGDAADIVILTQGVLVNNGTINNATGTGGTGGTGGTSGVVSGIDGTAGTDGRIPLSIINVLTTM